MYRAYMSLAAASAIAYAALRDLMHPSQHRTSAAEYEEAMGLIAAHISIVVPVFGCRAEGDPLVEIPREILAEGHFKWGGIRLEFGDARAPYLQLAIRKADIDPILDRLREAYAPIRGHEAKGPAEIRRLIREARK